jgi:hypothetical protein
MQAEINDPSGYVQGLAYAAADFNELDGQEINTQPIQHSVAHGISYHTYDMNGKVQQSRVWKKKLRDLIQYHQEKIVQFLVKPYPKEHTITSAHTFIQKYGKSKVSFTFDANKAPPTFLKEYIMDVSGQGFAELDTYMKNLEATLVSEPPTVKWTTMTKNLIDYMKTLGDELIRVESNLQNECTLLDQFAEKVRQLVALGNPGLENYEETMETLIKKQFETHTIETLYWNYINTLQKYAALHDILVQPKIISSNEPTCCVCMTDPSSIAFVPCGHTFCQNCSKKPIVCHVCRQVVQNRIKIFFT